MTSAVSKDAVQAFWDEASCGETAYAIGRDQAAQFAAQADARYRLEPYLKGFARFADGHGKDVLEVGVGMGADHLEWARSRPRSLTGVDLTGRAVAFTEARLAAAGLQSLLDVADAENLPFPDASFDIAYSWGVIHHSPDTPKAFSEMARVLRPGGVARVMIYHTWSLTGLMLWARFALARGRPFTSLRGIYDRYLESPGTKAYTVAEAKALCTQAGFRTSSVHIQLNHGDLLEGTVGQRHPGAALELARMVWPRALLRRFARGLGLYLLIEAQR